MPRQRAGALAVVLAGVPARQVSIIWSSFKSCFAPYNFMLPLIRVRSVIEILSGPRTKLIPCISSMLVLWGNILDLWGEWIQSELLLSNSN